MSKDYFLGVSEAELKRLERQHLAWQPETQALIQNAGLPNSKKILDLGCGPGFTSVEISKACPSSKVFALDKSDLYHSYLANKIKVEKLDHIIPIQRDILSPSELHDHYDGAFCRWFLAFLVSDLQQVLSNIYQQLKPGASFALMEYLTLESFTSSPPAASFDAYKKAWIDFYTKHGGDSNIATYLPTALEEVGFTIESITNVGGHSPVNHRWWNWWQDAFDHFAPRFVEEGLMTQEEFDQQNIYWQKAEANKNSFLYSAIISQIVATK